MGSIGALRLIAYEIELVKCRRSFFPPARPVFLIYLNKKRINNFSFIEILVKEAIEDFMSILHPRIRITFFPFLFFFPGGKGRGREHFSYPPFFIPPILPGRTTDGKWLLDHITTHRKRTKTDMRQMFRPSWRVGRINNTASSQQQN